MKVAVEHIREEGLVIESELDPKALDLNTEVAGVSVPLQVKVSLRRVNDVVNAGFFVSGQLTFVCGRCLTEFNVPIHKEFLTNYPLEKGERTIDLDPELRDFVMLEYPINPLCKKDCKGICPKCGVNLNDAAKCNCK